MSGRRPTSGGKRIRRRVLYNESFKKPSIRRLCRRAGIKRISGKFYDSFREVFKKYFLEPVLRDAIVYAENANHSTLTAADLVNAFQRNGMKKLYM